MCERARCLRLCREDCLAIVRGPWAMFRPSASVSPGPRAVSRARLRSPRPEPTMAQRGFALLFSFLTLHALSSSIPLSASLSTARRNGPPLPVREGTIVHGQARISILNTLILQLRSLHFTTVHNTNVLSRNATNGFYLENVSISPIKDGIKEITS